MCVSECYLREEIKPVGSLMFGSPRYWETCSTPVSNPPECSHDTQSVKATDVFTGTKFWVIKLLLCRTSESIDQTQSSFDFICFSLFNDLRLSLVSYLPHFFCDVTWLFLNNLFILLSKITKTQSGIFKCLLSYPPTIKKKSMIFKFTRPKDHITYIHTWDSETW